MLLKLLGERLGALSPELEGKIRSLSVRELDELAEKIFEIRSFFREGAGPPALRRACAGIIERCVKVWYIGRELYERLTSRRELYWTAR